MKAKILISCEHFNVFEMKSIVDWCEFEYDFPKIMKPYDFEKRIIDCEIENRSLANEFRTEFQIDFEVRYDIWKKIDYLMPSCFGKQIAWIYFDELRTAIEWANEYSKNSFKKIISSISIEDLKATI